MFRKGTGSYGQMRLSWLREEHTAMHVFACCRYTQDCRTSYHLSSATLRSITMGLKGLQLCQRQGICTPIRKGPHLPLMSTVSPLNSPSSSILLEFNATTLLSELRPTVPNQHAFSVHTQRRLTIYAGNKAHQAAPCMTPGTAIRTQNLYTMQSTIKTMCGNQQQQLG